jgi:hypothetical protein
MDHTLNRQRSLIRMELERHMEPNWSREKMEWRERRICRSMWSRYEVGRRPSLERAISKYVALAKEADAEDQKQEPVNAALRLVIEKKKEKKEE